MISVVGGLGVVVTLARLVLHVMMGTQVMFYFGYVFPTIWGLTIHFTTGAFLGRDRAEKMVDGQISASSGKRVAKGVIQIR